MLHSFQAAEESGAVSCKIPARNHFKVQSPTKLIGTRQSALAALLVDKSRKIPIESSPGRSRNPREGSGGATEWRGGLR
jgi:hypothetical protein